MVGVLRVLILVQGQTKHALRYEVLVPLVVPNWVLSGPFIRAVDPAEVRLIPNLDLLVKLGVILRIDLFEVAFEVNVPEDGRILLIYQRSLRVATVPHSSSWFSLIFKYNKIL